MPSQVYKRDISAPEMNITPLIDVTFLLIIFFMLVNNIASAEFVEMMVPKPDVPKSQQMSEENRIVVNVAPVPGALASRQANPLLYSGEAYEVTVGLQTFAIDDLASVTAALQNAKASNPDVQVLLRADAALYYEEVQPVMMALTRAGIATVNLAALMEEDGGGQPSAGSGDAGGAE